MVLSVPLVPPVTPALLVPSAVDDGRGGRDARARLLRVADVDRALYFASAAVQGSSEGREARLDCPRCGGRKTLSVSRTTGRFICYRCQGGFQGGLFRLLVALTGDVAAADAVLRRAVGDDGGGWADADPVDPVDPVDPISPADAAPTVAAAMGLTDALGGGDAPTDVPLPPAYIPLTDPRDPVEAVAWRYLSKRRLPPDRVRRYRIGYCPIGPYAGRVVVPVTVGGRVRHWVARAIDPSRTPKVLTPPGNRQGSVLFNLDAAVAAARRGEAVVVVEGVFDALRLPTRAVAAFGKRLTAAQRSLLLRAEVRRVVVAFDADAAVDATLTAFALAPYFDDVRVATLPPGTDPADLPEPTFAAVVAAASPPSSIGVAAAAIRAACPPRPPRPSPPLPPRHRDAR